MTDGIPDPLRASFSQMPGEVRWYSSKKDSKSLAQANACMGRSVESDLSMDVLAAVVAVADFGATLDVALWGLYLRFGSGFLVTMLYGVLASGGAYLGISSVVASSLPLLRVETGILGTVAGKRLRFS